MFIGSALLAVAHPVFFQIDLFSGLGEPPQNLDTAQKKETDP